MPQAQPELKKYLDKRVEVQLNGSRKVLGTLRGYDVFLNVVLDEATESRANNEKVRLGMCVIRAAKTKGENKAKMAERDRACALVGRKGINEDEGFILSEQGGENSQAKGNPRRENRRTAATDVRVMLGLDIPHPLPTPGYAHLGPESVMLDRAPPKKVRRGEIHGGKKQKHGMGRRTAEMGTSGGACKRAGVL
nr:small nuclear ribonucleoprotein g [Quercus suber]